MSSRCPYLAPLLVLMSCTPAGEPAPASTSPAMSAAPSAKPSSDTTAAAVDDPCVAFAAKQAAVIADIRAKGTPLVHRTLDVLPKIFGWCRADRGGEAWGIRLEELCEIKPFDFVDTKEAKPIIGRWTVVRIKGREEVTGPLVFSATERYLCVPKLDYDHLSYVDILGTPESISRIEFEEPLMFDYDGDGRSELLVRIQRQSASYSERGTMSFFTLNDGRLHSGNVGKRIEDHRASRVQAASGGFMDITGHGDVDADGRPDVYSVYPYMQTAAAPWTGPAPKLFARSLPDGSFSIEDPAALQKTLSQCGPADAPVLVPDTGTVDVGASRARLVCLVLRKGSVAARSALTQACAKRGGAACKELKDEVEVMAREVPALPAPP